MNSLDSIKNPISMLQEKCQKECPLNMPTYSEVSKSGLALPNANDKKFQILCEAFGCRAIGEGANKKTAKHQAAEKVLKRLMKRNLSNYVDDDDDEDDLDTSSDSIASDFVSQLLDYCVPRNFPKPEFELVKQYGPPHAPTFVLQCKVSSVTTSSTATNKKMAKQSAAQLMLLELKAGRIDEKHVAVFDGQKPSFDKENDLKYKTSRYLDLKKSGKVSEMGCYIKDRHEFFVKLDETTILNPLREIIGSSEDDSEEKFEKFKTELKQSFEISHDEFLDSDSGLMQFEVIIPGNVFTCIVVGTKEELWRNVLEYFRDMLK